VFKNVGKEEAEGIKRKFSGSAIRGVTVFC
jgi:hypothetical protein